MYPKRDGEPDKPRQTVYCPTCRKKIGEYSKSGAWKCDACGTELLDIKEQSDEG